MRIWVVELLSLYAGSVKSSATPLLIIFWIFWSYSSNFFGFFESSCTIVYFVIFLAWCRCYKADIYLFYALFTELFVFKEMNLSVSSTWIANSFKCQHCRTIFIAGIYKWNDVWNKWNAHLRVWMSHTALESSIQRSFQSCADGGKLNFVFQLQLPNSNQSISA